MNKITFLGTGTSTGVPQLGCDCPTCTSADPRDKRLRCSALVQTASANILIDCSPDFREQMLRHNFRGTLDAVLVTHEHYDHVGGIDDLRPFSYRCSLPIYADSYAASHLRQRLPYCLVENKYPGVPQLHLHDLQPYEKVMVNDTEVTALQVMHGQLPVLGYRIGDMAYITDMTSVTPRTLELLSGIRLLVVNGLRHRPHRTHQTIDQAIAFARQIGNQPTYIIHMSHDIAPPCPGIPPYAPGHPPRLRRPDCRVVIFYIFHFYIHYYTFICIKIANFAKSWFTA